MVLEDYIAAMNNHDAKAVAACFTEDALFWDGGGRTFGYDDLKITGKAAIYESFKKVIADFAKIIKLNPNSMEYDVEIFGLHMPCVGCAQIDENGKIKEYIVRPR